MPYLFPTGSYLCTLHMLPIRSHILRKLAVTFIAFAYRLATKRRLACTLWAVPHALKHEVAHAFQVPRSDRYPIAINK